MPPSQLRSIYDRAPRWSQTTALNLYGLTVRRRESAWRKILQELASTETLTRGEQILDTQERLRRILLHAITHVPRYAAFTHLKSALKHPEGAFDALLELPQISRDDVLDEPDSFRSDAFQTSSLTATRTSGTTGTPFKTWLEHKARLTSDALWWRRTVWAGYQPGDWIARIVGDPVVPLSRSHDDRPWRISRLDRRIYLSTFHLSESTAPLFLDVLADRRPAFLMGYPSAMTYLARIANQLQKPRKWSPRAVLFSSEPLYAHQHEAITRAFDAPIRGLYGCAERIVSAAECEENGYHLSLVDGFVEGQFGILPAQAPALITGLLNRAMPLIRFQLGDEIQCKPESPCPCGRTLPLIAPVITKAEDCVTTPSGRTISPSILTWAFKDVPHLRRAQIIQTSSAELEILVSPERIPSAEQDLIVSRMREYTFGEMTIVMNPTSDILPSTSGKTRFVVNRSLQQTSPGRDREA